MQLAILHHHLNRGGVTSVIANHLRALATLPEADRPERVVIFYDGQEDGWPSDLPSELSIALVEEPALTYDAPEAFAEPEKLADLLSERFDAAGVLPGDTLLHVHNHSLGKNASLPGALKHLAGDGWRMLLQVHDFAEDNRPENYAHLQHAIGETDANTLGGFLYPQDERIHYATLTQRDADILRTAGFAEERLHALPNPVAEFGEMLPAEEAKTMIYPKLGLPAQARLIVYPVRGIRRKNLGEMLLLSALASEGTYFAVTLQPKNPTEWASFDRWRRLAEELDLPCLFDTGSSVEDAGYGCDFKETLAAADAILTTSVAEGFGMVFLEAWLAGKPLVGRDLPEITREFKAAGMSFDGMWQEFRASTHLEEDFGRLPSCQQVAAIRQAKRPDTPLDLFGSPEAIEANAAAVREHYSAERIGQRLQQVYASLGASDASVAEPTPEKIVAHFADPERIHPVRFEEMHEPKPLGETIMALSAPLEPLPTGEKPVLPKLPGIKAVVFDVYGTLLVSGSGDISLASEGARGEAALNALHAVFREPETSAPGVNQKTLTQPNGDAAPGADASGSRLDGDAIVAALHEAIHTAHAASSSDHPEVEIRDIWRTVLDGLEIKLSDDAIQRLAVEYECRVNPIWPMPGMVETLLALDVDRDLTLGIVSNAQFFTPQAFPAIECLSLDNLGFEPDLCIWSFEHREAKPGTFLYERCAEALAARGIRPAEALFVGNDLRNDVWPAQRVGFKTALFAGDKRSLRWRHDDERVADVRPDAVVTELRQLLRVVGD